MRRRPLLALAILMASLAGLIGLSPVATAENGDRRGPTVYVGELTSEQFATLAGSGVDRHEIATRRAGGSRVGVEVVLSRTEAAKLSGLGLTEKRIDGQAVSKRLQAQSESDHGVFRPYSGPGGLAEELEAIAASHPRLVKKVVLGQSVRGQDIVALKLTKNARTVRDGARPAVLYLSAQHAREWITPEMTRRLLWHYLDTYGTDRETRRILDTTELWFVPVANPDGYDYTFTPGQRLWRKNLRDNNGDGQLTDIDGVDPNRNFPTKWNYDDEGSSSAPASQTYRGTRPASEPETRAVDRLMRKIRFAFAVNYHSAAELVLYGVGWQVATPSPDDEIAEALAGDDAHPAVPGYDPDLGAELYTTNGDTDEHASSYGTIAFTPEMSTCATISALDPDDAFAPEDCESVFNFPDSEPLIQAEYAKNLAFAVSVAKSARDPDDPVSVVGRQAPDFVVDPFDVSYGASQTVAVVAKKALRGLRLNYSVNGGRVRQAPVRAWKGGERYGDSGRRHYSEFRGRVRGTKPGDSVEVWFTAAGGRSILAASAGDAVANTAPDTARSRRSSEHFTYTVARTRRADVVVIADEDYNGVNPTYSPALSAPKYAQSYVDDLAAKGITAAVWDVSTQGVPHHLGVLSHFKAAVWYLGDNRLTQDPEDEQTDLLGTPLTDAAVAERAQYLTLSVRDYLNEGGKLLYTGETAGYSGSLGAALGGIYYGLDGAPDQDCVVSEDPFSDCLLLANDFVQYYLGGYARTPLEGPTSVLGTSRPLTGRSYSLGGAGSVGQPAGRAWQLHRDQHAAAAADLPPVRQHGRRLLRRGRRWGVRPVRGGLVRRGAARRRPVDQADQDGRSGLGQRRAGTLAGLRALLRHGARLRQRHCRGAHGRTGRLDHLGRSRRTDRQRRTRRLRPGVPDRRTPVPRALPHPRRRGLHRDRHHRVLEPAHGQLRWLATGLLRSERVRREAGRGVGVLRERSRVRRGRCVRRRHPDRGRRDAHRSRGLRERTRCVGGHWPAAGERTQRDRLQPQPGGVRRGDHHPGHGAPRLRRRTGVRSVPSSRVARPGDALPAALTGPLRPRRSGPQGR